MWILLLSIACTEVRHIPTVGVYVDVTGMYDVVSVPSGEFVMGSEHHSIDELPIHKVTLDHSFLMMTSEVTQELYASIMQENPSFFNECGLDCPVEKVQWLDAAVFANHLSRQEGREECYQFLGRSEVNWVDEYECLGWRLPTEAEWAWAARGAQTTAETRFAGSDEVSNVAWYLENSNHTTHPVCQKEKNALGLCDISGNVYEWVWDRMDKYPSEAVLNPVGGDTGSHRLARGGAWNRFVKNIDIRVRKEYSYAFQSNDLGFRLVRTAP